VAHGCSAVQSRDLLLHRQHAARVGRGRPRTLADSGVSFRHRQHAPRAQPGNPKRRLEEVRRRFGVLVPEAGGGVRLRNRRYSVEGRQAGSVSPSWDPNRPPAWSSRRKRTRLISSSFQCADPTWIPHRKAVRLAASSGASPRSSSVRYVARVPGRIVRAPVVIELLVALPGPPPVASTTGNETARKDRPCPRIPRRACPAMSHAFVPGAVTSGWSAWA
jgi:hypothetical protein